MTSTDPSRRSPAKRRAILDAATAVFLEQGYARSSVDTVAAAAGVGKQTVYSHFGDKERLFLAVLDHMRETFDPAHAEPIAATGDPLADLTEVAGRILDSVLSPRVAALHRLTIAELPHHPELQRMWRDETGRPDLDVQLADYLRERTREGVLDVPDPERAARQLSFLAISEGRVATLQGTEPLKPADRKRIAGEAAELIVRAYRPS